MATPTITSADRPRVRCAITISNDPVPVPALDWANGQLVAASGTSAQSAVVDASNDRLVEMSTSSAIYYTLGTNPTAAKSAGSTYLAAGAMRYVYVPLNNKIAVLQDSAGGNVTIIPALILT